jgi:hypothetical protein
MVAVPWYPLSSILYADSMICGKTLPGKCFFDKVEVADILAFSACQSHIIAESSTTANGHAHRSDLTFDF